MRLFDVPASPNCRKVRVVARELGLSLERVPVTLTGARDAGYLGQNPTGKVPTFVDDDGFVLWESGAILIHLAEKRPEADLFPADAHRRADVLRWMFFGAGHIQPWVSQLGQERLIKPRTGQASDPAAIALAERELARFLPILDGQLAAHENLAGAYSIADIAVGCTLLDTERRGLPLAPYPHLAAWRDRLRGRAAWQDE